MHKMSQEDESNRLNLKEALESNTSDLQRYKNLLISGKRLAPGEDLYEIIRSFDKKKLKLLTEIHKEYSTRSKKEHIQILLSKCKLHHDYGGHECLIDCECASNDTHGFLFKYIYEAFEELDEMPEIAPILKIVANSETSWFTRNLKIIFDFAHKTIEYMYPMPGSSNETGKTLFNKGCIYIGAKHLHAKSTARLTPLSTLAHELFHYAMFLSYTNDYKPYYKNRSPHEKYTQIIENCKALVDNQVDEQVDEERRIIKRAFVEKVESELITRIPHLIVYLKGNIDRLNELESIYQDLFEFFRKTILPDLENKHTIVGAMQDVKTFNTLTGTVDRLRKTKVDFISSLKYIFPSDQMTIESNCPLITMKKIYDHFSRDENFESLFIFLYFQDIEKYHFFNILCSIIKGCAQPRVLVDCTRAAPDDVLKKIAEFKKKGVFNRIHFIQEAYEKSDCSTDWQELTPDSHEDLKKLPLTFQGCRMPLKDLKLDDNEIFTLSLALLLDGKLEISKHLELNEYEKNKPTGVYMLSADHSAIEEEHLNEFDADDLIAGTEIRNIIQIKSEIGGGSTTELKLLASKLKNKFPKLWISYINLRDIKDDDKQSFPSFERKLFIEFLYDNILKEKSFQSLFISMFSREQVILLVDGQDKTDKKIIDSLCKKISSMETPQKTGQGNQLWVAYPFALENLVENCVIYRIKK